MKASEKHMATIFQRVGGTLFIPAVIYTVIFFVARSKGLDYFGDSNTWRNILLNTGATATIAFALATQIKHGRFDFSGGAIMTLCALVSIHLTRLLFHNGILFLMISIGVAVILSLAVAAIYIKGRIPIIICTVGMAIFLESLTLIFNGGQGATISSDPVLNFLGKKVGPLMVVTALSSLIYFVFTNLTTAGRQAQLLANNQEASVNIGIKEDRNVLITFIVSGGLYGIASVVFASQAFQVDVVSSVLGTVVVAFGSMLPVFMGFWIGGFSTDAVGILFSSLAVGILQYGIDVIAPTGFAGAFKNIIMGFFMIIFFLISRKGQRLLKKLIREAGMRKTSPVTVSP